MIHKQLKILVIALAATGLGACGGGGGGSDASGVTPSAAGTSTVGTITGFGSIFVNGVEFETDRASYRVDDEDAFDDSALRVGMKVRIEGTVNEDGVTGTAERILYDDDLEGPVDAGSLQSPDAETKTFTIFGMDVMVRSGETAFDDGASFASLAEGQILEISGYYDGSRIVATRVERQNDADDQFELKGTVSAYDGSTISLTLQNGSDAGPFDVDAAAELEIPADPVGQFVEVRLQDQSGTRVAIRIEREDEDLLDDDDDDVSVRGLVQIDGDGQRTVNGVPFRMDDDTEYKPESLAGNLPAGKEVKIEGRMKNGVLIAEEIETEDGDMKIEARLLEVSASSAKNGTLSLDAGNGQSLAVKTDNSTLFDDDSAFDTNDDESFDLDELSSGSEFVEVEAYRDDNGELVATRIKRKDPEGEKTSLKGRLEGFEPLVSLTLMGVRYAVDGSTGFSIDDSTVDATAFFAALDTGTMVKLRDRNADGTVDEVELDD